MSMSNTSETNLLKLLFQNIAWAGIGDANGLQPSSSAGYFYVALHTADPGETGNQSTNEVSYTGYQRVGVPRTTSGFSVNNNVVSNVSTVQFPECTGGSAVVTHFSVGLQQTGAGDILYSGSLEAARSISAGITPLFNPGQLQGTVD